MAIGNPGVNVSKLNPCERLTGKPVTHWQIEKQDKVREKLRGMRPATLSYEGKKSYIKEQSEETKRVKP
jgi:hypothetical protein